MQLLSCANFRQLFFSGVEKFTRNEKIAHNGQDHPVNIYGQSNLFLLVKTAGRGKHPTNTIL